MGFAMSDKRPSFGQSILEVFLVAPLIAWGLSGIAFLVYKPIDLSRIDFLETLPALLGLAVWGLVLVIMTSIIPCIIFGILKHYFLEIRNCSKTVFLLAWLVLCAFLGVLITDATNQKWLLVGIAALTAGLFLWLESFTENRREKK
jgi:hypothetical protein